MSQLSLHKEEGHQVPPGISGSVPTWTGFLPRASPGTFGPPAVYKSQTQYALEGAVACHEMGGRAERPVEKSEA